MLLPLWGAETYRPTRDIDLLGFGDPAWERLSRIFGEVASLPVEPDGMAYDGALVTVESIRGQEYGGVRVRVPGTLGNIRLPVQIDVASATRSRRQRSRPSTQPCWTCPPRCCRSSATPPMRS